MAHRIRLGPPWKISTESGIVRHSRHFGRPRTLDPQERLWIVCDAVPAGSRILVNQIDVGLADGGPFAADITACLQLRNEVLLLVPCEGAIGEVALEVRQSGES